MAQSQAKSDDWKNDEFVVCLRNVMKDNWDLLKSLYDERKGIIPYAQANNLKEVTAICKEDFKMSRLRAGKVGGALINKYHTQSNDDEKKADNFRVKPNMPKQNGVYVVPTVPVNKIDGNWKTIMVLGETGTGKSTTLNSMMNYLWDVSLEDHYRWVLIPPLPSEQEKGQSVTSEVTAYRLKPPKLKYGLTIVDTPGFGDTRGHQTDEETVAMIEKVFANDLKTINAVFFVLKSSQTRLTAMQNYVFNSMLRLFGKDIQPNLHLLITFCDGSIPKVYKSVEEYQLPYNNTFELNNATLFREFEHYISNNQVIELDVKNNCLDGLSPDELQRWMEEEKPKGKEFNAVTKLFWEMGMKAMKSLFDTLDESTAKSLESSNEVLKLRSDLQTRIENLHVKIASGLELINNIRGVIEHIKSNAKYINKNKNLTIKGTIREIKKFPTSNNTTTCSVCNYTCHKNCVFSNNDDKKRCNAMNRDGYCMRCPRKCYWNLHSNEPYILKYESKEVSTTIGDLRHNFDDLNVNSDDLKVNFNESTKKLTESERAVISLTQKIMEIQAVVTSDIKEVRSCIAELGKIALKPCIMEEDEYYKLMITREREQRDPGWQGRVQVIQELRQQARQVKVIQETADGGNATASKQLFGEQMKKLEKDLAELKKIQNEAPESAAQVLNHINDNLQAAQEAFIHDQNVEKKEKKRKGRLAQPSNVLIDNKVEDSKLMQFIQLALDDASGKQWTLYECDDYRMTVKYRSLPKDSFYTIRGQMDIEVDTNEFYEFANGNYDDIFAWIKENNESAVAVNAIKHIDDDHTIVYARYKARSAFTARDLCWMQTRFLRPEFKGKDGKKYRVTGYMCYSIDDNHPYYITPKPKHVRGWLKMGGTVFVEKDDNLCRGSYIVNLDPRGWITPFFANKYAPLQGLSIKHIHDNSYKIGQTVKNRGRKKENEQIKTARQNCVFQQNYM